MNVFGWSSSGFVLLPAALRVKMVTFIIANIQMNTPLHRNEMRVLVLKKGVRALKKPQENPPRPC